MMRLAPPDDELSLEKQQPALTGELRRRPLVLILRLSFKGEDGPAIAREARRAGPWG